jgi:hypothetical protein
MIKAKSKLKKILLIIGIVIVSFVVLVIAFISPIAKYLIEKYDTKYIGREVKVGMVYLNPFTAYIHIGNLRMYELKSDSVFITANSLNVDYSWLKMIFLKTYEISSITVNDPVFNIKQNRQRFNFNDIIEKFTPKEKKIVKKARTKFNILDIKINDGRVNYREFVIPVTYFLKNINITSPGMWWNRDTMAVKYDFKNGPASGKLAGDITINLNTNDFRLNASIKKFDLKFMEQYIRDMANYGHFSAFLDADVHAKGNFKSVLETNAKGWVALNDFHFGKRVGDDFASFEKLLISFREVNPKQHRYDMDSVILTHPIFVYETYDYLDNLQRMFGEGGSKIKEAHADSTKFNPIFDIAKGVQQIALNFIQSYYQVDRVAIYRADIRFNDFSPREKFHIALNPLYLAADSIDKNHDRFKVRLNSPVVPFGDLRATLSVNPQNNKTFEASYYLNKVSVPMLNPYLITYTSFPLDRGSLDFTGYFNASNGAINSMNHLVILDPRVGTRLKKKQDTKWIPVPLIMAFIRERGNVIDYEIPITGNLNNPKIHFKDIIFDLLKNIFVKPPTTPYAFKVRNVENEIEKSLTLVWETRQVSLRNGQEKFVEKIAKFLKDKPDAAITIHPMVYTDKEKEYILFYEAKKKYYKMSHPTYSEEDSVFVEKMSIKDSGLVHYLDKHYNSDSIFTIQQKCMLFVGENIVNARYTQLLNAREHMFMQYFKDNGTDKAVKMAAAENTTPFNGFSYYRLNYKGEIPEELREAYNKLDDINDDKPRRKYLLKRKRDKSTAPIPVP